MERERIYLPLLYIMLIVGYSCVNWSFMNIVKLEFNIKLSEQLRVAMLEKRARLEYRHIENNETWDLVNRVCSNPSGHVSGGFDIIMGMANIIIRIISLLLILISQVWWAAIVILAFSVSLFYIAVKSGKSDYAAFKEASKHERRAQYLQGYSYRTG